MKATVTLEENVHFTGVADSGHVVHMDGPPEFGGENRGTRPMEMMLLGLGGCTSFDVVDILRKGRQDITACDARIEAQRAATEPKVFTKIHIHFTITGRAINRRKVERAIALTAEKYCSASIMLERAGVDVTHGFEIVPATDA